jgi:Fe-S cluster assembly protein SufD
MTVLAPTGTPAERFTSTDPDDFAVPRGREEEWRFTPLRGIRDLFEPFTPTTRMAGEVHAPDGVVWDIVPPSDQRVGRVLRPADRVSALAFAGAPQALVVQVRAGRELDAPVTVVGKAASGRAYEHMVIEAGSYSRATVVVDYRGSGTIAENVEIIIGDGASLTVASVQDWDPGTVHLATHAAEVGRDASYRHILIDIGGSLVRIKPTVRFSGPGGRAELFGVSFAGPGQHFESRLYIEHDAPNCTSNVLYKNALVGASARTVWIGDVRIRPSAIGTNTYEYNRNLLLSDGARADSVPNLEIETGNIIGAGHASATGRFDDEQLFYLQSRGIPEDEARRLVVRGFFADVIARIGLPELQERLTSSIERRLDDTTITDELEQ